MIKKDSIVTGPFGMHNHMSIVQGTSSLTMAMQSDFEEWNECCISCNSSETCSELEAKASSYFSSPEMVQSQQLYEQAIARLIQSLERSLTSLNLWSRIAALACVKGALEPPKKEGDSLSPATLSLSVMKLMGEFLLQQCGPILHEEDTDDVAVDENVRDSAVRAIDALLRSKTEPLESQTVEASVLYRVHLSYEAVKRRCALPEEYGSSQMLQQDESPIAPRGLASLPRSRRSLCFEMLQSTIDGLKPLLTTSPANSLRRSTPLFLWVEFSINCLHGESDPRCLIQLLNFLADLQKAFVMILEKEFPVGTLFDAVSSYYPIQFTPPPHMAHTVTQDDLTRALWKIMSFNEYDKYMTGGETMFSLTLGVILEQLVPLPEDDPVSLEDQENALVDLRSLLRISKSSEGFVMDVAVISEGCIDSRDLIEIGTALHKVNGQTSFSGASGSPTAQRVCRLCRDMISFVALACERCTITTRYWNLFVRDKTLDIVRGKSTPLLSRSDVVYLACLTGCGGLKTLKFALDQSLPVLLRTITEADSSFGTDFATADAMNSMADALYGLAVLFASVQSSLKRQPAGLVLNPHPLMSHGMCVIDSLLKTWQQIGDVTFEASEASANQLNSLRIALVRSLETALMILPLEVGKGRTQQLITHLRDLHNRTTVVDADVSKTDQQLIEACSRSLGIALGEAVKDDDDSANYYSILRLGDISSCLRDDILPVLLMKVSSSRYCQITLSTACTKSKTLAKAVVAEVSSVMLKGLRNLDDRTERMITSFARVLSAGGRNTAEAFQTSDILFKMRSSLQPELGKKNLNLGVSGLQLPVPEEETRKEQAEIGRVIALLEPLHQIYESWVVHSHVNELLEATCKVIPPLDSNDQKDLAILLPFLSAALQTFQHANELDDERTREMISFLPEFILSNTSPSLRNYGITCLHAILSRGVTTDREGCPCLHILDSVLMTTISALVNEMKESSSKKQVRNDKLLINLRAIGEAISVTGSLGSAAIQRSGSSSVTADKVVKFLVDLACVGKAESITETASYSTYVAVFNGLPPCASSFIALAAVNAFGAILSSGPRDALWKQRLGFVAWNQIQESMKDRSLSTGLIGTSAYIVCNCSWKSLPRSMATAVSNNVLQGLSLDYPMPNILKKVVLAAVVKLISLKHDLFDKNLLAVVTGVLRAYATVDREEHAMACKIFSLQVLQSIPTVLTAQTSINPVRPAVISILEQAMVDKSSILRHAAVEVRNSWYLV